MVTGKTKVLWFTHSLFYSERAADFQVQLPTWVQSAAEAFCNDADYSLGIAFLCDNSSHFVIENAGIRYYPISKNLSNRFKKWIFKLSGAVDISDSSAQYQKIINDYKPHLIQIYGTEFPFADLIHGAKTPVIIHIQSIVQVYKYKWEMISRKGIHNGISWGNYLKGAGVAHAFRRFKKQARKETEYYKLCRYFMGRTDWDYKISRLLSPASKYYACDEIIRKEFFSESWTIHSRKNFQFVTIVNPNVYKGLEVIIKTAEILKSYSRIDFSWHIIGFDEHSEIVTIAEKIVGISSPKNLLVYHGSLSVAGMINILLQSDIYVHASHIENSSNSICEAMILGVPVIASDVGGTRSLINHNEDGILVSEGDPYLLAAEVDVLCKDKDYMSYLSSNARRRSRIRHDPQRITSRLKEIYTQILSE